MHKFFYKTPRGVVSEIPITVEIWGAEPYVGRIGFFQNYTKIQCSWVERGAAYLEITAPLDELSRHGARTDGKNVFIAKMNGKRQLFYTVEAVEDYNSNTSNMVLQTITAVSPWDVFYGRITLPDGRLLGREEFSYTGTINDILRDASNQTDGLIEYDAESVEAPQRTVTGNFNSLGDLLLELCTGTGCWIDFIPVLPGEPGSKPYPFVRAKVRSYRGSSHEDTANRPPQIDAGSAISWNLKSQRTSVTHVAREYGSTDQTWNYGGWEVAQDPRVNNEQGHSEQFSGPVTGWAVRQAYAKEKYDEESGVMSTDETGRVIDKGRGTQQISAQMSPVWQREFGCDGATPLQYDIGDSFDVSLPAFPEELVSPERWDRNIGYWIPGVVTEVVVTAGPGHFTVEPTTALPDGWWADNSNSIL